MSLVQAYVTRRAVVEAQQEIQRALATDHPDHTFQAPCLGCRVLTILDRAVPLDPLYIAKLRGEPRCS